MKAFKTRGMCRRLIALCAAMAACVCILGADTVSGVVLIRDVKGLAQKAAVLADRIMPGMGQQILDNTGGFLALPGWADIDASKPVGVVFLTAPGNDEPTIVLVMSALEGKKVTALPWPDGTSVAVEMRGEYVVGSMEPDGLKTMTTKRAEAYGVWPSSAGEADIYATLAVGRALGPLAETVSSGMDLVDELKTPLTDLAMAQVSRVSLTLGLSDDALDIGSRVYAVPKSALGDFLAGTSPVPADLARFLPGDCPAAVLANVNWAKLTPLLNKLWEESGASAEAGDEIKRMLFSVLALFAQQGPIAAGVSGNPAHDGMQTVTVLSVADTASFRAAAKECMTALAAGDAGEGAGVEYKEAVRDHGGVKVDRAVVTPPEVPGSGMQAPPMTVEIAAAQSVGVMTGGNETGDLMDGILDLVAGGGTSLADVPAYKTAAAAAPKDASAVFHLTFTKYAVKLAGEVQKQAPFIAPFLSPFTEEIPGEQPITGYARCAAYTQGPAVNFRVRVPTMLIAALGQRIAMLVQMFGGGGEESAFGQTEPMSVEETVEEEEDIVEEAPIMEEEEEAAEEEAPAMEEEESAEEEAPAMEEEEEAAEEEAPAMEEEESAEEEAPAAEEEAPAEEEDAAEETPAEEEAAEE